MSIDLKKTLNLGDGLSIMLGVLTGVIIAWMNMQVRIALVETKVQTNSTTIQSIKDDTRSNNHDLNNRLDKISSDIYDIKISMQNKEDRKK